MATDSNSSITPRLTLEAATALADEYGWPLPSLSVLARHIEEYNLTTKDSRWFAESAARFRVIQDRFSAYFEEHSADIANLEATKNLNDVDRNLVCVAELQSSIIIRELECNLSPRVDESSRAA